MHISTARRMFPLAFPLRRRNVKGAAWATLIAMVLSGTANAELPSIRFDRLQPLGAAAGSSIEVEVVGRDTEEVKDLLFDQPGLKAEFVKDGRFKITVAADVPEGTYDVRLVGRFGVSNSRLFAVSRELQDVAEKEPNNTPAEGQPIAMNSAVNGLSDGNGQDSFRFPLIKGERVTIDCQAEKLDSLLDANLILSTAGGTIVANNGDYHGKDPFIDFVAPDDGDYVVVVHDLSYRGPFPYRLIVSNRPQVENVFPRAVEPGKPVELIALGRNFKGAARSARSVGQLPLDELRFTITPPTNLLPEGRYQFLEHPTDHSVWPTAATCTVNGFQIRVPGGAGALHPALLVLAESPVTLESEPNDDKQKAQPLTLPAVVSGRFDESRDADWYEITPAENASYTFEVFSERIAGRADPYIVVFDDKDNNVGELDDYGHRTNAFDGHLRDPYGSINLQGKRTYRVLVQDRYSRGGARYQYVLAIRPPAPDFHVAAIHSENPGPAGTNVRRGGAEYLDLIIHQRDGFNGPITITAEGLPAGVHAAPTVVNNNSRGQFVLWSDPEGADWNGSIRLVATGAQGEPGSPAHKLLRREVRPYTRVWNEPSFNSSRPTRELAVGIRDKAPYVLKIVPDRLQVESGKKAELKLQVVRYWTEFKDKITVIPLGFHPYFNMGTTDFPADKLEIPLSISVQNGARPGDYTLSVLGQAQVPFNKDPKAASRPNTLVSTPSLPVTITVTEPVKK